MTEHSGRISQDEWENIRGLQALGMLLTLGWVFGVGAGLWLLSPGRSLAEALGALVIIGAAVSAVAALRASRIARTLNCPSCRQTCFDDGTWALWDRGYWMFQRRCVSCGARIGSRVIRDESGEASHD